MRKQLALVGNPSKFDDAADPKKFSLHIHVNDNKKYDNRELYLQRCATLSNRIPRNR